LFDRAEKTMQYQAADDDTFGGRIYGGDVGLSISPEAKKKMPLSPEASQLLAAAIAEAVSKGDLEAARKIADLGKDPAKLAEIVSQGTLAVRPPEKENKKEAPRKAPQ
jgi:hypothetical protein